MKISPKRSLSVLSITLLTFFSIDSFAQSSYAPMRGHTAQRKQAMERIHTIKIAYITDKLHLTSEQAANFWPIYYRYEQEIRSTRRQFFQKYHNTNPEVLDESASRQYVDDNLDYQQEMINIKRKYNDEFAKVISEQQLALLYKAERDFKKLLIRQLNEHNRGKDPFNEGYNNKRDDNY
ncbi:MAG TPA: hypothetical protein VN721_15595 [Flavipsychrobacter sp.]|nr:hypothetical protein [Flavipsychrobacter sp.]